MDAYAIMQSLIISGYVVMKTKKTKNLKKLIILLFLLALFSVLGFFIGKYQNTRIDQRSSINDEKSNTVPEAPESELQNPINEAGDGEKTEATAEKLTGVITLTGVDTTPQGFHFGSIASGVNGGECVLTLSQSGQTSITKTANLNPLGNNQTCAGFTVPGNELPSSGKWSAQISVQKDGQSITSNVMEFEVGL